MSDTQSARTEPLPYRLVPFLRSAFLRTGQPFSRQNYAGVQKFIARFGLDRGTLGVMGSAFSTLRLGPEPCDRVGRLGVGSHRTGIFPPPQRCPYCEGQSTWLAHLWPFQLYRGGGGVHSLKVASRWFPKKRG